MKGWVYVITNKSMPGVVKVGFSMKDPSFRALDLDSTGIPTPYQVEYDVLVNEPYQVEQKAHSLLRGYSAGKEWFHVSAVDAVAAIRQVAVEIIHETFHTADHLAAIQRAVEVQSDAEKARYAKQVAEITERYAEVLTDQQRTMQERVVADYRQHLEQFYFVSPREYAFWGSFIGLCLWVLAIAIEKFQVSANAMWMTLLAPIAMGYTGFIFAKDKNENVAETTDAQRVLELKKSQAAELINDFRLAVNSIQQEEIDAAHQEHLARLADIARQLAEFTQSSQATL